VGRGGFQVAATDLSKKFRVCRKVLPKLNPHSVNVEIHGRDLAKTIGAKRPFFDSSVVRAVGLDLMAGPLLKVSDH